MSALAQVKRLIAEDFPPGRSPHRACRGVDQGQAEPMAECIARWAEACAEADAIMQRSDATSEEARTLHPPEPPGGAFGPFRSAQHQAEAAFWHRQTDAIDKAFGVRELEDATNHAHRVAARIADDILTMQPATLAEAALKYGVLLKHCGDGKGGIDTAAPFHAFLADLERLAQPTAH